MLGFMVKDLHSQCVPVLLQKLYQLVLYVVHVQRVSDSCLCQLSLSAAASSATLTPAVAL